MPRRALDRARLRHLLTLVLLALEGPDDKSIVAAVAALKAAVDRRK